MANRRPDYIMLAAMELFGVVSRPIADMLVHCYDSPAPVNYETAVEFVKNQMFELIASGALVDEDGIPEPSSIMPVSVEGRSLQTDAEDEQHDPELCEDCEWERRHPPRWYVDAYFTWSMINEDN